MDNLTLGTQQDPVTDRDSEFRRSTCQLQHPATAGVRNLDAAAVDVEYTRRQQIAVEFNL